MDKGFFILLFLTPLATRSIVAFVNSDPINQFVRALTKVSIIDSAR